MASGSPSRCVTISLSHADTRYAAIRGGPTIAVKPTGHTMHGYVRLGGESVRRVEVNGSASTSITGHRRLMATKAKEAVRRGSTRGEVGGTVI